MKTDNVTLIIQGPLNIYTTFMMYRYHQSYPIILSIPKTISKVNERILQEIQRMMTEDDYNVSLFMYDDTCPNGVDNSQNRYFHFLSTQLALTACKTPYAVKIRSDEFYSNLSPFIDKVLESDNKIITNDIFFRNPSIPLHPSDHLVGGRTEDLLDTFKYARELSENTILRDNNPLVKLCRTTKSVFGENLFTAEQQFCVSYISSYYAQNKLDKLSSMEVMKDRFDIVPSTELGTFKVSFNSNKKGPSEFFDDTYFNKDTDINTMKDYK